MATINIEITDQQFKEILCTAFEGGSNYWYMIERYDFGNSGLEYQDFQEGGKKQDPQNYWHPAQLVPLTEGCAVIISDMEGGTNLMRLDRPKLEKGAQIMAEKYPDHFGDWMNESGDATTGDVFLQCCLFGEAIYG